MFCELVFLSSILLKILKTNFFAGQVLDQPILFSLPEAASCPLLKTAAAAGVPVFLCNKKRRRAASTTQEEIFHPSPPLSISSKEKKTHHNLGPSQERFVTLTTSR